MARRKNVVKSLVDSAESAIFAGIEIHNKPRIPYRYPTATLLVINAWELALKAYVYKYIGKKQIIGIDLYQDKTRPIAIVAKTLRV